MFNLVLEITISMGMNVVLNFFWLVICLASCVRINTFYILHVFERTHDLT